MNTQLTIQLPDELHQVIRKQATNLGLNRSDIIQRALRQYFITSLPETDGYPYSKVSNLVGITDSGISDLGERHREYLLTRMRKDA